MLDYTPRSRQPIQSPGAYNAPGATLNPFHLGLQLGTLGAASGLTVAAIHRNIRKKMGDNTPVAVFKPVLIGSLIGAAAGAGGASYMNQQNKYACLGGIVEKQAEFEKEAVLPLLALLPLLGKGLWGGMAAYSGAKAVGNVGKAVGSAATGDFRGAGKNLLHGLGNAALAIPGAGQVGKALQLGGRASSLAKGTSSLRNILNTGKGLSKAKPGRIGNLLNKTVGKGRLDKLRAGTTHDVEQVTRSATKGLSKLPGIGRLDPNKAQAIGDKLQYIDKKYMYPALGASFIPGLQPPAPGGPGHAPQRYSQPTRSGPSPFAGLRSALSTPRSRNPIRAPRWHG